MLKGCLENSALIQILTMNISITVIIVLALFLLPEKNIKFT